MGLGDKLGGAMDAFGGTDEIVSKISESGIDLSALAEMDPGAATSMLEDKGIDLSMLEGLGLSVEDVIEKIKEQLA
jgi:predicted Fe-Mo cluster-binding NifX family protein